MRLPAIGEFISVISMHNGGAALYRCEMLATGNARPSPGRTVDSSFCPFSRI